MVRRASMTVDVSESVTPRAWFRSNPKLFACLRRLYSAPSGSVICPATDF